jgi:glycosyltransferase involved in cell wall biosynthesis
MKILYVVPYVPSLIRVRSYQLIEALRRLGHQVTIMTLWTNESERAEVEALKNHGFDVKALPMPRWRSAWNCLAALPGKTPLQAVYSWNPGLANQIESMLSSNRAPQFDVTHVEHLRGVHYALHIKSRYPRMPVVWDSVDCISYLFSQASGQSRSIFGKLVTQFDLGRTRYYEKSLPKRFDRVLVTSPVDRQAFLDLAAGKSDKPFISVVPMGVDLEYFCPGEPSERESATVVFSGKMSYHANVTMALYLASEIMPKIWERCPQAKLILVGKDPPRNILALQQNPAITVTGTVEDIRPYLRQASVAAVPLIYGAGMQNKVLEAMACATPVVAMPGAVAPLQVQVGRDVLVAENATDFADQVLRLLNDPGLQCIIGEAGRKYVEGHHRWDSVGATLEGIYHEVINTKL